MNNAFSLQNPGFNDAISLDPIAADQGARTVINAGVAPSRLQLTSMNNYVRGMRQDYIWTKMKCVVLLYNNGLVGAFTPLLVGTGGTDPWNASLFAAGDLTVNGVIGDGASKVIKTGLLPSTLFSSDNNSGVSLYVHTQTTSQTQWDLGITNPVTASNVFQLNSRFNSPPATVLYDNYDNITFNGEANGAMPVTGFYSCNRVSSTDCRVYAANSTNAWAQYAATIGAVSSSRVFANNAFNTGICVWSTVAGNGVPFNYSARRYSYISFHDGLTSAEGQMEYNRVQTFRTSIGGGFV